MTPDDRACLAIDLGGASTAVAFLGRVDGRWRLLGASAAPATVPLDALVATLARRFAAADPALASELDVDSAVERWPRLIARTGRAPRMTVLAATDRSLDRLASAARGAGWSVLAASAETADPLEMTRLLLRRDVAAVLVGAAEPPATDERSVIGDLAELVAAAAGRRPELTVVLSGGLADLAERFGGIPAGAVEGPDATETPAGDAGEPVRPDTDAKAGTEADEGPGETLERAPDPAAEGAGTPAAEAATDAPAEDGTETADPGVAETGMPAEDGRSGGITPGPADALAGDDGQPPMATLILGPASSAGDPPGEPLRALLDELRSTADDGRRAMVRTTATLAAHLGRRVETIEIGQDAGLRAVAWPAGAGERTHVRWAILVEAALIPDPVDDAAVDGVLGWSTLPLDRYRLRDRLAELRLTPWAEAHGDGAPLRMAAARAALERLVGATPDFDRPVPDLIVVAGGAWAVAPGAAVGLAVADVLRRPGASQLAFDHARLLGPLGTIEDDGERRAMVADLLDDLLAPLGSVVIPAGLRGGRSSGRLIVHGAAGTTELDLVPGGLELVDLPPGESAVAEFQFRDPVTIGTRGRRFAIDVAGGLGGLLVDLRDVPLHLPDRADRRRELLAAWQRALWSGLEG